MSELSVTIQDTQRAVCGRAHGSDVERLVAALAAEPETIEELHTAAQRFYPPGGHSPIAWLLPGVDVEPYDAGACVIDLAARYVAYESTYSSFGREGVVDYIDHARGISLGLPYHLSEDWLVRSSLDSWEADADERSRRRQAAPRIDARAVLYVRLADFIIEECLAARGTIGPDGNWSPPEGWTLQALPERVKPDALPTPYDAIAEIHARWLMTPRDDLQGCTPRDVLLAKRKHIDWDLQDRGHQWSFVRQCPPGISRDSAAYRICGFGSHENYMYYDLVRHLLGECWDRIVQPSEDAARTELYRPEIPGEELLDQLRKSQQEWLHAPIEDSMSRETPAKVIDLERRRVPLAMQGEAAMIDCDCPMCQMMATPDFGPMFCHFDGCNNDPEYPFTHYATRGEWEAQQREYEEMDRAFEEKRKLREAGLLPDEDLFSDVAGTSTIWKTSFSAPETEHESPVLRLFGIAGHLGELVTDLKGLPGGDIQETRAWMQRYETRRRSLPRSLRRTFRLPVS